MTRKKNCQVLSASPILCPPDAKNWFIVKDPDAGDRLKAGGEGDDSGWDGWMASPTRWIWVWTSSRNWWWTGRPGMLSNKVGQDWATELTDWQEFKYLQLSKANLLSTQEAQLALHTPFFQDSLNLFASRPVTSSQDQAESGSKGNTAAHGPFKAAGGACPQFFQTDQWKDNGRSAQDQ